MLGAMTLREHVCGMLSMAGRDVAKQDLAAAEFEQVAVIQVDGLRQPRQASRGERLAAQLVARRVAA